MAAADIQAAINSGLGSLAAAVGEPISVYRPQSQHRPVAPINLIAQMLAYFDPDPNFDTRRANLYNKPIWYGGFDRSDTLPGDYLVTPTSTYFIASQQPLLPTACVECNATMTVKRPLGKVNGIQTTQVIAQSWPLSALNGTKGELPPTRLPGETRAGWLLILMPAVPGLDIIRKGDIIVADANPEEVFEVASNELTDLGWRITAGYAGV